MSRLLNRLQTLLLLACAGLFFFPLGARALWDSDEGRYAEIAREMLASHQWLIPHLNGVLYFEKPPMAYWVTALGLAIFGDNAFGARFFSAFFGLLTVAVVFRIGQYWKNERTGLLAGLILATSTAFFVLTQYLVVDMVLTFWLTLALYAAIRLQDDAAHLKIRRWAFLLGGAIAGAFLTKGLIALLLPGAILILHVVFTRSYAKARRLPWFLPALLFSALAAPWFIWMSMHFPFFASFFFIHEHFARYFTQVHQRSGPLYYFVPVVLVGFLPWVFFLPQVVGPWFQKGGKALRSDSIGLLLVLWAGFIFVFFSFSGSKLPAYMLPIFPALALLTGHYFEERLDGFIISPWILRGIDALLLFFVALILLLKWVPGPTFLRDPILTALIEQGSLLALTLSLCVLILVGVWGLRKTSAVFGGILIAQVLFLSSLTALAPALDPWLSTQKLARIIAARAAPQDRIVVYGVSYETYVQSLAFYTQRRIVIDGPIGEFALGASHAPDSPEWFAEGAAADDALKRAPIGTWVVTNDEYWARLRNAGLQDAFTVIEKSGRLSLVQRTQ